MFLLLPIVVLFELTLILYSYSSQPQRSIREAFLASLILVCAGATILAEGLGFWGMINVWTIRGIWLVTALLLTWFSFERKVFLLWRFQLVSLEWPEWSILSALIIIALLSAVVAYQCPPNTVDSLVYHLPRLMFWIQNGSLAYYPTPILRQLNYPPGAEILLIHCYALAGDDRWLNFLQWFAMLGSVVGVSMLARFLGAGTRGQLLTALVASTIPMGVLQSNSTQTDYVLTLWIICMTVFIWSKVFIKDKTSLLWVALSIALAVLTKGTAFIILPFIVFLLWMQKNKGVVYLTKIIGTLLVTVILLNASYWTRNIISQPSHGFFPQNEENLIVEHLWPQGIAANMIRHSALHFMTPIDAQVKALHDFVFNLETILGVKHDDRRIFSYDPANAFSGHYVFNEDVAANTLHFILGMVMIFIAVFFWSKQERAYAVCVLVACVLMVSFVKWQPWASRFHLPLFLLAAPLIGIGLNRMRRWGLGVGAILLIIAISLIFTHPLRPLIGNPNIFTFKDRQMWYFAHIQDATGQYGQMSAIVKSSGCKNIGLITSEGSLVYPLWPLISSDRSVQFNYMDVNNFSRSFSKESQTPCLVLTLDKKEPQMLVLGSGMYRHVWENNYFQIYSNVKVQ